MAPDSNTRVDRSWEDSWGDTGRTATTQMGCRAQNVGCSPRMTKKNRRKARRRGAARAAPAGRTATPVRPPALSMLAFVFAVAVPWVASLTGIFRVLDASPRVGALILVADLIGVPLLVLFWTHATISRELRFEPMGGASGTSGAAEPLALSYFVPGKGGGAWLSVVEPRLVGRTKAVLLVATSFGRRLPRFVRRQRAALEELVVMNGSVVLVGCAVTPR